MLHWARLSTRGESAEKPERNARDVNNEVCDRRECKDGKMRSEFGVCSQIYATPSVLSDSGSNPLRLLYVFRSFEVIRLKPME